MDLYFYDTHTISNTIPSLLIDFDLHMRCQSHMPFDRTKMFNLDVLNENDRQQFNRIFHSKMNLLNSLVSFTLEIYI